MNKGRGSQTFWAKWVDRQAISEFSKIGKISAVSISQKNINEIATIRQIAVTFIKKFIHKMRKSHIMHIQRINLKEVI